MPKSLVYLIYNSLLPLVLLLGLPSFIIKGIRRGGLRRNFRQRFARYSPDTLQTIQGRDAIWIHAVSVGEVFVALKIIDALHAIAPEQPLILSTTTTTGYAVAEKKASDRLSIIHNPVDLPWIVARVLNIIQPKAIVLVESEIWPNLLASATRRDIPVKIANARLSPRSAERYARALPLVSPIFSQLHSISVPFDSDPPRWQALGIPKERIKLLGSVKFDHTRNTAASTQTRSDIQKWLRQTGMPEQAQILLAGSTHQGEEALIAQAFQSLREHHPSLVLVIVPRHAERAEEISTQLVSQGFQTLLKAGPNRVESVDQQGLPDPATTVWIANTTGELNTWFELSTLVVIGKSLCAEGGQNPVEPILSDRPVIVGPNMQNFSEVIRDLLEVEGIRQLSSADELEPALHTLLQHPDDARAMAARGKTAMEEHIGAASRTAQFILDEW